MRNLFKTMRSWKNLPCFFSYKTFAPAKNRLLFITRTFLSHSHWFIDYSLYPHECVSPSTMRTLALCEVKWILKREKKLSKPGALFSERDDQSDCRKGKRHQNSNKKQNSLEIFFFLDFRPPQCSWMMSCNSHATWENLFKWEDFFLILTT